MAWSHEEFQRTFSESQHVEFKTSAARNPVQEAVVAFSNAGGGCIFIGVSDHGDVTGLGPGRVEAWTRDIHQTIGDIRDPARYHIHPLRIGERDVLLVQVHAKVHGFAQTSGGLILQRRGASNRPLYGGDLAQFVLSRTLDRQERQLAGYTLNDIDGDCLTAVCEVHGWDMSSDDLLDLLRGRGLLADVPSKDLTVTGALFLVRNVEARLGKAYIELLRFPDDEPQGTYDRRQIIRGPLQEQVVVAARGISEDLGVDVIINGVYRYELDKLPAEVIREAVANAVAHRAYDYSGTPTRIEMRPGRVTITSPGGLIEPVTEENIREANAARNKDLIEVLRRFRLAENQGRGVDLMQDEMARNLLDPPKFRDLGHAVEVTLPVHSPVTPEERAWVSELDRQGRLEPGDRLLLVVAARGERLNNARAREELHCDALAARSALRRLVDAGLVRQLGERGGATYVLADKIRRPAAFRLSMDDLCDLLVRSAEQGSLTNQRVRDVTGMDRQAALSVLTSLVEQGRLVRSGSRRGTSYGLPSQ